MLLAEVGEVVRGEIIFGGNLLYGHVRGLQVHENAYLALCVEPMHDGHAERLLKLAVEGGDGDAGERGELLRVDVAAVVAEHQLTELEVLAGLISEHIDEVVTVEQLAEHHQYDVSLELHEAYVQQIAFQFLARQF